MQIVVNTRLLLKNKLDGIGWFSYQTLRRIAGAQKDVHFVFLFDRPYDESFIFSDNITPIILGPQARHPFLYYAWFHVSVRSILNRMKPDLFLSPDGFLSPGATCRQLAVIHDINFAHNPGDVRWLTAKYYNHFFPQYARLATRIATVSEYSKQDLVNTYHLDPHKIDVVYNGINEGFKALDSDRQTQARVRFAKGKPYFLFVGSQSPRKNLVRLLEAFELFKQQCSSDLQLVVAGANFWGEGELKRTLGNMKHNHEVHFTGRLLQEDLELVTGGAFALTYVPYFEGFGIPLVEAMQCDVPIISSNVTCMPEIAGEAALYADPYNVQAIADCMLKLYGDATLRKTLIEKGQKQKLNFSWDKSASLLWQSITKAL
ncbi:MAG: glycosyltransferase family 4 protein [Bacteroidetes bacterium]|nr:glycosyltransferase family 4 protein [Bacteroidota bacterium]